MRQAAGSSTSSHSISTMSALTCGVAVLGDDEINATSQNGVLFTFRISVLNSTQHSYVSVASTFRLIDSSPDRECARFEV